MLAQRAVSEDPRWTRAVQDQSAPIPKKNGAEKVPGTIDYLVTIPRPDRFHDADWEKEIHRLRQGTSDGEK